jgi:hypothetical protein
VLVETTGLDKLIGAGDSLSIVNSVLFLPCQMVID